MSQEQSKIAGQIPGIMSEAAEHLRSLSQTNVKLAQANTKLAHEVRVLKLAKRMEDRGLENGLSVDEKVAKLMGLSAEKVANIENAVEMAAGGFNLGTIRNDETEKSSSAGGSDDLENYITSESAFGA